MLNSRLTVNLRSITSNFLNANAFTLLNCRSVGTKDVAEKQETPFSFEDVESEEEIRARENAIEKSRNKSQLFQADFNRQHDRVPFEKPVTEFHESLRYRRRLYGKYGESSKVNPSILWPSKKELQEMREYEEAVQPFTVKQLVERVQEKKIAHEKAVEDYEARVLEKVKNVKSELLKFHKKVAEAKKKALELAERKNKLIEQVRQHFDYKLQPTDQKFRAMLAELQKQDRAKQKQDKIEKKEMQRKESSETKDLPSSEVSEKE